MSSSSTPFRKKPLLIVVIVLVILVTAGVWAWRHFPAVPKEPQLLQSDSLP